LVAGMEVLCTVLILLFVPRGPRQPAGAGLNG
jgi:hypothetical protein